MKYDTIYVQYMIRYIIRYMIYDMKSLSIEIDSETFTHSPTTYFRENTRTCAHMLRLLSYFILIEQ